jgi:hypothetical protein
VLGERLQRVGDLGRRGAAGPDRLQRVVNLRPLAEDLQVALVREHRAEPSQAGLVEAAERLLERPLDLGQVDVAAGDERLDVADVRVHVRLVRQQLRLAAADLLNQLAVARRGVAT